MCGIAAIFSRGKPVDVVVDVVQPMTSTEVPRSASRPRASTGYAWSATRVSSVLSLRWTRTARGTPSMGSLGSFNGPVGRLYVDCVIVPR